MAEATAMRQRRPRTSAVVVLALVAGVLVPTVGHDKLSGGSSTPPLTEAAEAKMLDTYGRLPLAFETNVGQVDPKVKFISRSPGYSVFLTDDEAVIALSGKPTTPGKPLEGKAAAKTTDAVLRMRMVGAKTATPVGTKKLRAVSNYLIGDDPAGWHTGVPSFAEVTYRGASSGIDLKWYGNKAGNLEYDVIAAPGADINSVAMKLEGAKALRLDKAGDLVVSTSAGTLRQKRPVAFQDIGGRRKAVAASYLIRPGHQVGFALGDYDITKAVVIDPVIEYSTYLGSTGRGFLGGNDTVGAVAVDSSGSAYLAGTTNGVGFPTTSGAYQPNAVRMSDAHFARDAFVSKFSPDGSELIWSTYLGGPAQKTPTGETIGHDRGMGVAIDADGHIFVTGETSSPQFPVTNGAFQRGPGASALQRDAFVTQLSADGRALIWSSYLGGSGEDEARSIAVWTDPAGAPHVTVAGHTSSANFPVRDSGSRLSGVADAFVTRFAPGGSTVEWSSYLGGGVDDEANAVVVDSVGATYVAGTTAGSGGSAFPTTPGAAQVASQGGTDAFVAKLAVGGSPAWASFLGGSGDDTGASMALDATGLVVAGATSSEDLPGPRTAQAMRGGGKDAFLSRVNLDGSALVWSTYLGGAADDGAKGLAVGPGGIWVTGLTSSTDFPQKLSAQESLAGGADAFVARFEGDGSGLGESTYLGGLDDDIGAAVAVDSAGHAYVAGATSSNDFPALGAYQTVYLGGDNYSGYPGTPSGDAFLAKLAPTDPALPTVTSLTPNESVAGVGGTSVAVVGRQFSGVSQVNFGDVAATNFRVDSPTHITATAPPQRAGPVFVTVTTPAGTSAPNPFAPFYYGEGAWKAVSAAGAARQHHTVTVLPNGKVLLAGGCDPSDCPIKPLSSAELFDPVSGRWTPTSAPMSRPRYGHTATLLPNGMVLVAGGKPGDSVTTPPIPPVGPDRTVPLLANRSAELYDPATDQWSAATPMLVPHTFHTATLLGNGKLLVVGGEGPIGPHHVEGVGTGPGGPTTPGRQLPLYLGAEVYDSALDLWTSVASPFPRQWHTATLLGDGKVLVDGGFANGGGGAVGCDGFCPQATEVFDPEANGGYGAWTQPDDHLRRIFGTATLLRGSAAECGRDCGKVVVVGGSETINPGLESGAWVRHGELFDPRAGGTDEDPVWKLSSSLAAPRFDHVATRLASGRVLVAGGLTAGRSDLPKAEVYHPVHRKWLPAGSPLAERTGGNPDRSPPAHTATLLSSDPNGFAADPALCGTRCGMVLVVGGVSSEGSTGKEVDIYTPAPTLTAISPAGVPPAGGAALTLTGTGFTHGPLNVKIGDTALACPSIACTVDSYSQITLTGPPATNKATVGVTVASGSGVTDPVNLSYTGLPGAVKGLAAEVVSATAMKLGFDAAGAVGDLNPPVTSYAVKLSTEPMADEASFDAASALCEGGLCKFIPKAVGQRLSIDVGDLDPGTTYYYAVRAVAPDGQLGPISKVEATTSGTPVSTGGTAGACPSVAPDAGQLAYPKGYSLVGLPAGTVVPALSQLYSWFDQGAGGAYASQPVTEAVAAGRGYWAYFSCPSVVDLPAVSPQTLRLPLGAFRASMLGNPSPSATATVSGQDFTARWDPSLNAGAGGYGISGYREAISLRPGEGLWAFSYVPTQVVIAPQG